jgi:hypothetical protein
MHMIKKWQMNRSHRMPLSAAQQFPDLVISNTKYIVIHFPLSSYCGGNRMNCSWYSGCP